MTTDIKELAQWLRANGDSLQSAMGLKHIPFRLTAAADALEALAGEVESLKHDIARHMHIANEVTAERDRLKAALVEIKTMPARIHQNNSTSEINKILFEAQQFVAGACAAIARKALGDAT